MILRANHALIFAWYLWVLDVETQRILRPMMLIMIDPDLPEQDRYDAYVHLDVNMTHFARNKMQISPAFGTKQGLINAIDLGEKVKLYNPIVGCAHDGVYCYTGAGWYATLTIKDGRVVKVA